MHRTSRREFLRQMGLGAAALWLAGHPLRAMAADEPPAPRRPNIVFLLADQWRASAMGYAGDPNVRTPHLDRLATQALNFRNTVSVCPVCTPYRAALLTGRFPTSTGMFLNDAYLPDTEVTLAEMLQAAGYATGYIGKWHLDGHGRKGFIPPARRQGWEYWKAAECDHNYPHSHYYTGDQPDMHFWDGYDAFAQTRDAQAYIRAHAGGDQPFALMVSYGIPHFPHQTALQEYQALYPPETLVLPPNVPEELRAVARKEGQGYYAHCTALDRCVGDLMATLAETGTADDTILVFTSDHGEMLGSHGCPPLMKQVPWNEAAHVPFLLRYPAVHGARGRVVETPMTTPDITATLLGLAGVPVPTSVEGEDLADVVRSGHDRDRAALYMNPNPFSGTHLHFPEYRGIRTRRHTYVRGLPDRVLLYDDATDPCQMTNLADEPTAAETRRELAQQLQAALQRIADPFHPARYYLDRWGYPVADYGSVPYSANQKTVCSPTLQPPAGVP